MATADHVTVAVEAAFGDNVLDDPATWTAITSNTRAITAAVAAANARDVSNPGGSALLGDSSRSFDPEYSSGAYYGDLDQWTHVRFRVTYDGTTYDLFRG